jgi:hypothetical protein
VMRDLSNKQFWQLPPGLQWAYISGS